MDDHNAILDALQTEALIKALSVLWTSWKSKQLGSIHQLYHHVLGRPLIRLMQQPDHDSETYKKLSRHFKSTILVWDEAALKKVAKDFVYWFLVRPVEGEPEPAFYELRQFPDSFNALDAISSILCNSEWLWEEIFIDKAFVYELGHPPFPLGLHEILLFAHTKFSKDKQWILRAVAKLPVLSWLLDPMHYQDPDIMLAIMSSDRVELAQTYQCEDQLYRDAIINWGSKYREITVQKETFDLVEQIVAPHVLASNLNQGQEATSGLTRHISDFIGLPLEKDWPVLLKAHANYETLHPSLSKAGENAPLRKPLEKLRVSQETKRESQETMTVEQLVTEVGDHHPESPLLPLNRRGPARVRRPVERFDPSS
jgi:hypothetical protein